MERKHGNVVMPTHTGIFRDTDDTKEQGASMDFEGYRAFVQAVLTPQRFQHSLGVVQVMEQLAPIYELDVATAQTIGILHDAAKDLDVETQQALAHEANHTFCHACEANPIYLHGPVGAYRVARELHVTDPVILDTISRHAYSGTGVALSPAYVWCLRFADTLEPSRQWTEIKESLSPVVYAGDMLEGAYRKLQWNIPFLESLHIPIHPNMRTVYRKLCQTRQDNHSLLSYQEMPC
jgi:predicted HD superfamily hydrolase involved in NAD metabolism